MFDSLLDPPFPEHVEWLHDHLDGAFPEDSMQVLTEIMPFGHRVDVFVINPPDLPFQILLSAGVSTKPMPVPKGVPDPESRQFVELMMLLPASLDLEEEKWWMDMFRYCARFAHDFEVWVGIGHTLQFNQELEPFGPETEFVSAMVTPSATFKETFTVIEREGRRINILGLYPLRADEHKWKLEHGFSAFLDQMIKNKADEAIRNDRPGMLG